MVPRMVCKGLQPLVRGQIRPTFTTEVQLHSLKQRREILLVAQKQSLKGILLRGPQPFFRPRRCIAIRQAVKAPGRRLPAKPAACTPTIF